MIKLYNSYLTHTEHQKGEGDNTMRGATEIVRNLKPRISFGCNQKTAEGGACSV